MTAHLPNPFMIAAPDCGKSTSSRVVSVSPPSRFVLDVPKFVEAIMRDIDRKTVTVTRVENCTFNLSPGAVNSHEFKAAFMQPLLDVLNRH